MRLSRLTCAAKIESKIQWNAVKVFFRLKCKTYSELGRDGREGKYCNEKIGLGKENFILLCYPWILVILNFSISLPSCVVLCGEALGFSPGSFSVLLFRAVCGERHQQKERRRKYGIIWSGLKLFRFKHQNWI